MDDVYSNSFIKCDILKIALSKNEIQALKCRCRRGYGFITLHWWVVSNLHINFKY